MSVADKNITLALPKNIDIANFVTTLKNQNMSSKKIHGIISTDHGRYVMATLKKNGAAWRVSHASSWNSGNQWPAHLLMNTGIVLGLHSSWRSSATTLGSDGFTGTETMQAFNPVIHTAHITAHQKQLGTNAIAFVPDDAFLSSIPLSVINNCPASFISVYTAGTQVKIGVTIQKKLYAVFSFGVKDSQEIESHVGQILRSVSMKAADAPAPAKAYFINLPVPDGFVELDGEEIPAGALGINKNDGDILKAAGAAIAYNLDAIPEFVIDTSPARFRHIRACIYGITCTVAVLSILMITGLLAGQAYLSGQIKKNKAAYESVLGQSKDLQILLAENDSLAARAQSVSRMLSNRTGWSTLLDHLGRLCPEGLSISRFGSEPIPSNNAQVRIALNGSAVKQTLVTDFIGQLQKQHGISSVSLSSMEQSETGDKSTFTILCILRFSEL
jgi:Tfp pilus assembly protein PilN